MGNREARTVENACGSRITTTIINPVSAGPVQSAISHLHSDYGAQRASSGANKHVSEDDMRKLPPHIIALLEPKGFKITEGNTLGKYQGKIAIQIIWPDDE